jgi:hypothetical protein
VKVVEKQLSVDLVLVKVCEVVLIHRFLSKSYFIEMSVVKLVFCEFNNARVITVSVDSATTNFSIFHYFFSIYSSAAQSMVVPSTFLLLITSPAAATSHG